MTSRILPLISLSLLLWLPAPPARAQYIPADDFFNSGAQLFISNNIPAALERVENGLKTYPDDAKLKRLEELLKQQQQQQQQQQNQQNQSQQQQQQQQQKNQQQQNQNQQSQPQNSPDQQKQQAEKQKQAEQKKAEQQKQQEQKDQQQQQANAQKKEGDQQDQPGKEGEPLKAGQLTPEEAKRLLDAQKDNEQLLRMKPQEKPQNPLHTIKDW